MKPMTDEELAADRATCEAATLGPWASIVTALVLALLALFLLFQGDSLSKINFCHRATTDWICLMPVTIVFNGQPCSVGWTPNIEIGLRSDNVVVWRRVKAQEDAK